MKRTVRGTSRVGKTRGRDIQLALSISSMASGRRRRGEYECTQRVDVQGGDDQGVVGIPRIRASEMPVERFWTEFMLTNRPVLISGLTDHWKVDESGRVRPEVILELCGACCVTVHDCGDQVEGMSQLRTREMSVAEYLGWWTRTVQIEETSRVKKIRAGPDVSGKSTGKDDNSRGKAELLYLKDWNFEKEFPEYGLYEWPQLFREDWLNDYEHSGASDHRFVYLGPPGTFTPLHKDTLNSFSWSASIVGRKRWWMMPPEAGPGLEDADGMRLFDIRSVDHSRFPNFKKELSKLIVVDQLPGEVMFVPSGWWHQVQNLDQALSINHNWINGANILSTWRFMNDERQKVLRDGGKDLETDEITTQDILEFRTGYSFETFYPFIAATLESEAKKAANIFPSKPLSRNGAALQKFKAECNLRLMTPEAQDTRKPGVGSQVLDCRECLPD